MKNWMYLIGLAMVIITTGCNTMYGEDWWAAESEWPWETVSPESQGIRSEDEPKIARISGFRSVSARPRNASSAR